LPTQAPTVSSQHQRSVGANSGGTSRRRMRSSGTARDVVTVSGIRSRSSWSRRFRWREHSGSRCCRTPSRCPSTQGAAAPAIAGGHGSASGVIDGADGLMVSGNTRSRAAPRYAQSAMDRRRDTDYFISRPRAEFQHCCAHAVANMKGRPHDRSDATDLCNSHRSAGAAQRVAGDVARYAPALPQLRGGSFVQGVPEGQR